MVAKRVEILSAAAKAVETDRQATYGDAKENFDRIAQMWSVLTGGALDFKATDVALFMAAMKLSRLYESPDHLDSWVDLAGYAALGGEIGTS